MDGKIMLIGKEPSTFLTVIFGIEPILQTLRRSDLIVESDHDSKYERR
jgi:hypothetical protein